MTTTDRIKEYHALLKTNPEAAKKFREANAHDTKFEKILSIHEQVVPSIKNIGKEKLDSLNSALNESDPAIAKAMAESIIEDIFDEVRKDVT